MGMKMGGAVDQQRLSSKEELLCLGLLLFWSSAYEINLTHLFLGTPEVEVGGGDIWLLLLSVSWGK